MHIVIISLLAYIGIMATFTMMFTARITVHLLNEEEDDQDEEVPDR